jgi:hypothetical protein
MELPLTIVLLFGGFGDYRSGYYGRVGGYGVGGILGTDATSSWSYGCCAAI